jgi:hypothetical protein
MKKAERRRDQAEANYMALVAANESKSEREEARSERTYARDQYDQAMDSYNKAMDSYNKAMDLYKSLIDAIRPVADTKRVVAFALNPDVRVRLARPFHEWLAGESFDVTGLPAALGFASLGWQCTLFVRAEGAVLREWESGMPHMAAYGTSGIGKSTLLQLAVLRSLAKGEPVLLHAAGINYFIELNDAQWSVTKNADVTEVTANDRGKDIVLCYDSNVGFRDHFGSALALKRVLIMHSPSAHFANTGKIIGLRRRFIDNPTVDELCAIARFAAFDLQCVRSADRTPTGVERDEVLKRINRYGRSIRFVCDPQLAEAHVEQGLADMVKSVVNTLRLSETSTTVHRLMLMVPRPAGDGDMLVFLSDDIRDRAVRAIAASNEQRLLALANTGDMHGSLRCQIFENLMLCSLGRAGSTITFDTGVVGGRVLTIADAGVTLLVEKNVHSLPLGEIALRSGVLYRRPHSHNESWNAIVVEGNTAFLVQMTVGTHHPVEHNDILAGTEFLEKNGFKVKNDNVHIVFLVPPSVFKYIEVPKKMLNSEKQECAGVTSGRWPQEKWCVNKIDNHTFWPAA